MSAERRRVKRDARKVREHLANALDLLDDLAEDADAEALSLPERSAVRAVREHVLAALQSGTLGAPALFAVPTAPREVTG